ncbi:hypothetical protein L4C38_13340 [Vibrio kasasachensis]|uniref:hypothetical protein n=1 Tax=Vibrio kasasachensis TaxID=2910248 RepID=UPI003D1462C4
MQLDATYLMVHCGFESEPDRDDQRNWLVDEPEEISPTLKKLGWDSLAMREI